MTEINMLNDTVYLIVDDECTVALTENSTLTTSIAEALILQSFDEANMYLNNYVRPVVLMGDKSLQLLTHIAEIKLHGTIVNLEKYTHKRKGG